MKRFDFYYSDKQTIRNAYEMMLINIRLGNDANRHKSCVITSSEPQEGKTSLAVGLSIALASSGWKVLLVDGDMRKQGAAKKNRDTGLADFLCGRAEFYDILNMTNNDNMFFCPSGSNIDNPVGLLYSERLDQFMQSACREYDFVLIDTPDISSVIDGSLLAAKADLTLLVAKMGLTRITKIKRAKEQLENIQANLIGIIFNEVKKRDYKRYYEFRQYKSKDQFGPAGKNRVSLPT